MSNQLKNFILTCLAVIFIAPLSAQLGLELRPGYNEDVCPGFDENNNTVIIEVVNMPPLNPAPNTRIEYYWLITHEQGEWIYQTNFPARPFLVTLDGEHTMRCRVLYVNELTSLAYASFWSAPLIVETGSACD